MPPHPNAVSGLLGRNKAGENGSLRMSGRDRDDVRQHPLKPGHLPFGAFGKHSLHIDADMHCALTRRTVRNLSLFDMTFPRSPVKPAANGLVPTPLGKKEVAARNPTSDASPKCSRDHDQVRGVVKIWVAAVVVAAAFGTNLCDRKLAIALSQRDSGNGPLSRKAHFGR